MKNECVLNEMYSAYIICSKNLQKYCHPGMQGVHVFWPVLPLGRQCTSGAAAGLKPPHEGVFHAAPGTWSCWSSPTSLFTAAVLCPELQCDISYIAITTLS